MILKQETTYKDQVIKVGDTCSLRRHLQALEVVAIIEWGPKNEWVLYGYKMGDNDERVRYEQSWSWKKGAPDNPPPFLLNMDKTEEYNDMRVCTVKKWIQLLKERD